MEKRCSQDGTVEQKQKQTDEPVRGASLSSGIDTFHQWQVCGTKIPNWRGESYAKNTIRPQPTQQQR